MGRWVPRTPALLNTWLILTSIITSVTLGYDGSSMNGLNILPGYSDYFNLNTALTSLNTAIVWMGSCVAGLISSSLMNWYSRRRVLLIAAVVTIIGTILQAAAQDIAMFVIGRFIIGLGTGISSACAPTFLAETLPHDKREWGLAIIYDFWYVGSLIAAGVTYGTAKMPNSTWSWRLPSLIQGVPSVLCIAVLPFVIESPVWLLGKNKIEAAYENLAIAMGPSYGPHSEEVILRATLIMDEVKHEKEQAVGFFRMFKTKANRRANIIATSVAVVTMLSGNNIISYYLGTMLDGAGITNSNTQLEINVILQAVCLVMAILGTAFSKKMGRRKLLFVSLGLMTVFLFMFGGLMKAYGTSTNKSGIYGTVAVLFLTQMSYSFGLTPLTVMLPPEVLNHTIRAAGMSLYTFVTNGIGLFVTFVFPFALDASGFAYKMYLINAAWNVLELVFCYYYWIETAGLSLNEIAQLLDATVNKHSQKSTSAVVIEAVDEKNGVLVDSTPKV